MLASVLPLPPSPGVQNMTHCCLAHCPQPENLLHVMLRVDQMKPSPLAGGEWAEHRVIEDAG